MLIKSLRNVGLLVAISLAALGGFSSRILGQNNPEKPSLVVSIAPLDQTLKNVSYILRAAGVAELSGMVSTAVNAYTAGVDRTRPIGFAVRVDESQNPAMVLMLPVTEPKDFFEQLKLFGEIDDLGDGMFAMSIGPQTIFARSKGGWLFAAQQEEHLKQVAADPMNLLGNMSKRYDLSVRVDVQSIPESIRNLVIDNMREGIDRSMAQLPAEERSKAEIASKQQIESIEQIIRETREAVLGWSIDQANKKTMLDFGLQFEEGSKLDKQVSILNNMKTQFPAFQSSEGAVALRTTTILTPEEASKMLPSIEAALNSAISEMEKRAGGSKDFEVVKKFILSQKSMLETTIKEGHLDGGAIVSVDGDLLVVAGGRVADGVQLAASVKNTLGPLLAGKADGPKIQFDAYKHKEITFHTGSLAVPSDANEEAKKVFGNEAKFVIGTGPKAVYFALGKNCEAKLKEFIDKNGNGASDSVSPMEAHVDLQPLLGFIQQIQPNPVVQMMAEKIQEFAANDSVLLSTKIVPRGFIYRLTVEEGVLRAAGAAAKGAGNRGGRF